MLYYSIVFLMWWLVQVTQQDVKKENPLQFKFRAKFFPEDISEELIQEITQRLFFLQVTNQMMCDSYPNIFTMKNVSPYIIFSWVHPFTLLHFARWRRPSWMMRTIVLQRQPCYWHHTLFKPNMVTTAKTHTSQGTLPTTGCCLRGKRTKTWWQLTFPMISVMYFVRPLKWMVSLLVFRVLEQHKLTKEQWEDRIQTWHEEHRGMLRYVSLFSRVKVKCL